MKSDSDNESNASGSSSDNEEEQVTKQDTNERPNKKSKLSSVPLDVTPTADTNNSTTTSGTTTCKQPIIILLDQATIETIKDKRGIYELINCDDHRDICRKKLKIDPNEYRPDILHQEILAILDSPLNKAGLVKLYIKTKKNILIDVNPSIRIPRTYKRFAGLFVQLLHKMKIKSSTESTTLLKIIKNPFSQYLPPGTITYGMSCKGKLYNPYLLAKHTLNNTVPPSLNGSDNNNTPPVCYIIGAMSTGHISLNDHPYIQEMFSISEYPLSGAAALSRIATGIEHHWGIV